MVMSLDCFGIYPIGAALSIISRSAAFGIAAASGYLIGEDIAIRLNPTTLLLFHFF